jgi:S1-C subfamily serine protease
MLTALSNQLADLVAAAAPSVVQVQGHRRPVSGVVYADQVVVTTTQGIGREDELRVRGHDMRSVDAQLVGWDDATGIAVLRAGGLDAPPAAPSSTEIRVGHLGIALARSWSNAVTASAGIVAVIGGPLRTGRRRAIDQVLRTTAPMHDGFAGGAFLDASGGLAGINTAAAIRGLGVVIPASIAWNAAAVVVERGGQTRGYLGIAGQPVRLPEHQRGGAGQERGLLVLAVTPGGPAAHAGMLIGDVVLALGETAVDSPETLMDLLASLGAGVDATLHVLRGGAPIEMNVTLADRATWGRNERARVNN